MARLRALWSRPQQFLWDRDTETVRLGAFTIAVFGYAVLGILVGDAGDSAPASVRVVVAAASLGGIVWIIESLALWLRSAAIRGVWVYLSDSGNWGLAEIGGRRANLTYRVQLFRDYENLDGCLHGRGVDPELFLGHATSTFVEFIDRQIHIRYTVEQASRQYEKRSGFLVVDRLGYPGFAQMTGYWVSTTAVDGGEGRLHFARSGDVAALTTLREAAARMTGQRPLASVDPEVETA